MALSKFIEKRVYKEI